MMYKGTLIMKLTITIDEMTKTRMEEIRDAL